MHRVRETYASVIPSRTSSTRRRHYLPRETLFESIFDNSPDEDRSRDGNMSFYSAADVDDHSTSSPLQEAGTSYDNDDRMLPQQHFDVVGLLQEQQAMLQKILMDQGNMQKQQDRIISKQKLFEEKFNNLEEKLSSASSSSGSPVSHKPRQLTVIIVIYYIL